MTLRDEFATSMKMAAHFAGTEDFGRTMLHKIITGPPQSGKSTLAHDYAYALFEAGFVAKAPVEIECAHALTAEDIKNLFDAGKDSVMILRHPESAPPLIAEQVLAALEADTAVIILTGDTQKIDIWLGQNETLKARFNLDKQPPVMMQTERSFTAEEQSAFIAAHNSVWRARDKQRRIQRVIGEWRDMRDFDVTAGADMPAPALASFSKKPKAGA